MLKKDAVLNLLNSNNSINTKINENLNLNIDELTQLINRLSELFKKYINQLKENIMQNKAINSYIDIKTNYIQVIISNIINHNYTFEQLKSLEETIKQIKEMNNNYKLNIFNDEQNMNIFLEETNILFKSIKQKYKIRLEEWSNYLSIPISLKTKKKTINNLLNIKNDFNINENNEREPIHGANYTKIKPEYKKKRTKSTENQINNNRNMNICNSQKLINENLVRTAKSTRNKNKLNNKGINLINLNLPMNKSHSIYNIDIRNEVLLNKCFKSEAKSNHIKERNKNNYNTENNNYRVTDIQNINLEKKIENLIKEVLYYKRLVNLLSKNNNNKNNINVNNNIYNSNNINNKLLMDKLKLKENEIISKDKKIKLLYLEINKFKNQLSFMNNGNIQSEMGAKLDALKNIKSSINIKDYQRYKTESNLSNQIKFNSNCGSYTNIKDKNIENEALSSQNDNLKYIKRIKYLEKENIIIKSKLNKINIELSQKPKKLENENILFRKEIIELKKQLKNELDKKEDLNKMSKEQKVEYEYEISKINDKRTELSKILSNKNSEIIKLQQDIILKEKELEKYKELINKKELKTNTDQIEKIKQYYKNIITEKEAKQLKLKNEIDLLNEKNNILFKQNDKNVIKISELTNNIKQLKEELLKLKDSINNKDNEIKNIKNEKIEKEKEYELKIKQLKEENDGLKQFTLKQQKILIENEQKDEKISILQKEKETLKQYFIDLNIPLPNPNLNDSNKSMKTKKDKQKKFEEKFTEEECFNILMQLNEAKKEIESLKKKNEELFNDLDCKKLKNDVFAHISAEKPLSNYEEEFDLKKMAKGVKEKNRSQDINIDYPGIQQIKERYRELDFYYNSLEELVKKMLLSSTCTNKNKSYIIDLCKIVGFDDEITNKIINNKIKKGLLKFFG